MITCYLRYIIAPYKVTEIGQYCRMWIPLVNQLSGTQHGYFCLMKDQITLGMHYLASLALQNMENIEK